MYLGDFKEDGDIFFKFTTRAFATGIPGTLANTPVLSVYIDEATATEKTTAEAYFDLDVDFDSITGLNNVRIDLSGDAFFATGADYTVVITTGEVDSVSVIGEVVATFSIENRSMGQPAGATLAADIAAIKALLGSAVALDSGAATIGGMLIKMADDNGGADFDAGTDSLQELKDALLTAANVNAEVVDALVTDTHAEPATGAPGATVSIEEKISWLYALFRNETRTTATLLTLRNDANDGDIAKATLSDDATTFKKQEFVSG